MAIRKESIASQIARIHRLAPKLDAKTGMLYSRRDQLTKHYKKVTLFGLFVSDENTFLIRPHLFETKRTKNGRNAMQWRAWFRTHYGKILRESILPGMGIRTNKFWRLYRLIGWAPNDYSGFANSGARKQRYKTKRHGRKIGRLHPRR